MGKPTPFDVDDIWTHVQTRLDRSAPGECWLWMGATAGSGYGHLGWCGEWFLTHRIAYQAVVGDIPDGCEIDHLCRVPLCCNPEHLEAVSHAVNVRRGVSPWADKRRQTHCKNGHEFTSSNTIVRRNGTRECRTCKRTHARESARRRAVARQGR